MDLSQSKEENVSFNSFPFKRQYLRLPLTFRINTDEINKTYFENIRVHSHTASFLILLNGKWKAYTINWDCRVES